MKQTIYNWSLLCFILIITASLGAQSKSKCKRDFVIKTQITKSTCMANGVIEVTLDGDLSDIEMGMTEYALRPLDGTEGTSLQFSKNNVLRSVAAGTYIISVRTFCIEDTQVGVVTESRNVVVPGDYKPLMAEFDLNRRRKSYLACPTGIIAFNVQANTGYGDLTFHLSKAPAGIPTGEISPTKGGTSGGYVQYTLSGLYPVGDYQIDVYDSCSKATMTFTLEEVKGFPPLQMSFSRPNTYGDSHYKVQMNLQAFNNTTYPDHYTYYANSMYEIALVPATQTPTEADWQIWRSYSTDFTLPTPYSDYYNSNSLNVYQRVKGCNETMEKMLVTNLRTPYFSLTYTNSNCEYYNIYTSNYTDADGFWCYPLNIKITNRRDGSVFHDANYDIPSISLNLPNAHYGDTYDVVMTDSKGTTNKSSRSISRYFNPYLFTPSLTNTSFTYNCNSFRFYIQPAYSGFNCVPVEMVVNKKNTDTGVYEHYLDYTFTSTSNVYFEWEYGEYQLIGTYNRILEDGTKYTSTSTLNVPSPKPTKLTITSITSSNASNDLSNPNYGYLRVSGNATFPIGTRFTVTAAPAGFRHIGRTITSTSSDTYFNFGSSDTNSSSSGIYMPTGDYTITTEDDCGNSLSATATLVTGYDPKGVKYIIEEDECAGARIKLDRVNGSYVKYFGNENTSYTNFKIIKGPTGGYETALKKYNEDLQIVADGEYIIGTVVSTSYPNYYIKRDTIKFEKSKPVLKPSVTSAYVCADPGATLGYMIFTGQGGKAPYTYELLKANGTSTGLTATGGADERVVFNYGLVGETYIVRISDACGNSTTQEMTLADLKTQSIIYSIPPTGDYCTGDEIKLNCITLGQTSYLWEKKVSEGVYKKISEEQNPRITSATADDSGVYRVTVTPEYCGQPITGELTIKVYPPLTAGAMSANQEICVATRAAAMSCNVTGGKGEYSYQWQMSTNQTLWTDVTNATNATISPLHTKSGVYYYRLQITDDCTTVTSPPVTLDVKPCYIMVNPNLRSIAKQ